MGVRAKKHLGQHFLKDRNIASKIADTLLGGTYDSVLEIGPGTGVLTQFLLKKDFDLSVIEIDSESVDFLEKHYPELHGKIFKADFLKADLRAFFKAKPFAVIGNFPYNISTQIIFKILENKELIPEVSGMFQKEVAMRITAKEGSKTYGIQSVLTQAFYEATYLFSVPPSVFYPPPKVDSGVLRLVRKNDFTLPVSEKLFFQVVKTAFNQRRKTLRNSLKTFRLDKKSLEDSIFAKRPEQLPVAEFIRLTQIVARHARRD